MSVQSVAVKFAVVDLLSRGLDHIKSRMKGLSQASKEVQRDFDRMNRSFKWAAYSGIATKGMYNGLKPAVAAAGDLQAEMLAVRAELMGSGKDAQKLNAELKALKATAFGVQAKTPFDMSQIVALEKELIKAGATVKDVMGEAGAAAAAASLAVYENMDPVETGKALIGIGTPFKIAADQYMNLADLISRASSASTTGAYEIAEGAKYAAGPLAALGKDAKEMLALSAVMAQVGVDGSQAGTSLKTFFNQASKIRAFRDAKGDLLPTVEIIKKLREQFKGMGEAERQAKLEKMFGERGLPVAIALLNDGVGSYEEIVRAMDEAASLQDKLNLSMTGFKRSVESLQGTAKSTIEDLFQPALRPLTYLVQKTNEFVALIGKASMKSGALGEAVSGISLGGVVAGGVATAGLLSAGLIYGRRVLKGVGGLKGLFKGGGGLAGGIATGKAVEAATGVTPVFVTNWPGGFGSGSAASMVADSLSSGGGMLKTLMGARGAGLARLGGMGRIGAMLAGGVGSAGLGTTLGLAAGVGVGSYELATALGADKLGKAIGESSFADKTLGKLMDLWYGTKSQPEVNVNVHVDKDGRPMVDTNSINGTTTVKTPRGNF